MCIKKSLYFMSILFLLFSCSNKSDDSKLLEELIKKKGEITNGNRTFYYDKEANLWTPEKCPDEETKKLYKAINKANKITEELVKKAQNGDIVCKYFFAEWNLKGFICHLNRNDIYDNFYVFDIPDSGVAGGVPIIKDLGGVLKLYEELAEKQYVKAQTRLGDLYSFFAKNDVDYIYNLKNAKKWYQMAADNKNDYALFMLNIISGKSNIDFDYWMRKSRKWGRHMALAQLISYLHFLF